MDDKTTQTSTEDVQDTNPQETGAEKTENPIDKENAGSESIDYKVKFTESSREANRLLDEKKALEAEVDRLRTQPKEDSTSYGNNVDDIPGFETLGEEEQKNLLAYTKSIEDRTLSRMYKDPALAFAKETYNEKKWDDAYGSVAQDFPELSKDDFKGKYFKKNVDVPSNIGDLLKDLAKIELFDRARDLGAKDAREQNDRIEVERSKGGDKTPTSNRSLEDWSRLAQENPAKFAKLSQQFENDLEGNKLK